MQRRGPWGAGAALLAESAGDRGPWVGTLCQRQWPSGLGAWEACSWRHLSWMMGGRAAGVPSMCPRPRGCFSSTLSMRRRWSSPAQGSDWASSP